MSKSMFTSAQAEHALEVVLRLMKERRFFLSHHDPRSDEDGPVQKLNSQVFGPALELDRQIRDAYLIERRAAEASLLRAEFALGVARPDLSGNKQIVQCNRYTGGLDICQAYPLRAFAPHVPKSTRALARQCLGQLLEGKSKDDIAPKEMREYEQCAEALSEKIWTQFDEMDVQDPANPSCLILLESRFDCGGCDSNNDFMQGRTRDMQKFPHALGYLFYMHSLQDRIVRHSHVVFSTSRVTHVNVQHWSGEKPSICYDKDAGYTCPVIFATVL